MANLDEHILPIDPDDPKLYWIFRDEDFVRWKSEVHPQVLLLLGGPLSCRMAAISSHIAHQETGAVFFFSCSSDLATTFAHSILRHILEVSDDHQAKSITTTFLSTLLDVILQTDPRHFQNGDSITTMKKILDAPDSEHFEALTKAVEQVNEILETTIIIDGIDKLGEHGVQFIEKFCSQPIISPKFKLLFTCRPDRHTTKLVAEVLRIQPKERQRCIEYDKERQGLGRFYPLVVNPSN